MKIALCFSGEPRSFQKGYEYYKRNLLNDYDVDVYIHTWNKDGVQDLLALYNPKSYLIETKPKDNGISESHKVNNPDPIKRPAFNAYCMFQSIYKSSQLMQKSGKEYDWVIKSRTDYALNVKIPFAELDSSKLYIPNCRMFPARDYGNDQFAFSSQINMINYMSVFENAEEYYAAGHPYIGEDLVHANLKKFGLCGENLIYVDMNNPFPPGNYNSTWHSLIRDDMKDWVKFSSTLI